MHGIQEEAPACCLMHARTDQRRADQRVKACGGGGGAGANGRLRRTRNRTRRGRIRLGAADSMRSTARATAAVYPSSSSAMMATSIISLLRSASPVLFLCS
uniref:Uncharacterized protein n=1 Tax=Arundo donax TaxID=35708 RepID=A0A0A9TWG9_ARUDO